MGALVPDKQQHDTSLVETMKKMASLLATCVGLATIIIGLKYAIDVFQIIFTILNAPLSLTEPLQQMAASFGGSAFDIKLTDRTVPLAKLIALLVYCCGALLCAFLTMALMQTGAKIVSLTAGDRAAVKQILQSAFGTRGQPKTTAQNDLPPPRG